MLRSVVKMFHFMYLFLNFNVVISYGTFHPVFTLSVNSTFSVKLDYFGPDSYRVFLKEVVDFGTSTGYLKCT